MSEIKGIEIDCRFLDALSDAVLIFDENLSILYVSSGAERVLGKNRNELLLKDCRDLFGKNFSQNIESGAMLSYKINGIKKLVRINYISRFDNFFIAIISPGPTYEKEDLFMGMVGVSKAMKDIFEKIKVIAPLSSSVLITGETGTGKEMVAEAIHKISGRAGKMIKINCSAFPETLLESELFGYVKGAFTGADKNKPGKFQLADNGTLFLDEIGDLPINLQPKILRAVEKGEIEILGDSKTTQVNTRVICATNRNIEKDVHEGKFRTDLYFRISVFRIHIPPLRERKEDIIPLCEYILDKMNEKYGLGNKYLTKRSVDMLLSWTFPGNIRELENLLERAYIMSKTNTINEDIISEHIFLLSSKISYQNKDEKERIIEAMRMTNSIKEAANALGVSRITLWRKMKKYGIVKKMVGNNNS